MIVEYLVIDRIRFRGIKNSKQRISKNSEGSDSVSLNKGSH